MSPADESGPISRRSFVAATAIAAVGARAVIPQNAEAAPMLARRGPPSGVDPWLEVDRAALRHNLGAITRLSGGRPVIAVVKNNAYGLGLELVGPLLDTMEGVSQLAVVRADEAFALNAAGVRKPILLMGPASEEDMLALLRLNVIQSADRESSADILALAARRARVVARVHLYVDTGMHRMGIPLGSALASATAVSRTGVVRIDGAFTELTEDAEFDRQQAARLRHLQTIARANGVSIPLLHAASSDAVMHQTIETFLDAVRPGLALYGGYVSERAMQRGELRPAYRLKARVIRIDQLAAGEGVSYHRRYVAERPMRTATLAIGHVDGYPSGAVRGGEVFANGQLFPVIGTVSASHTIIALGEEQRLEVGDDVTLVGPDHPAIHPNEVAKRAGWSEYNMFMHLSPKLAKRIV